MRNSILNSYLKKFIRSEAFISVIIVFVLALGIIGTSYALYMDVDTDTDYQLVEVGDLSVGFDNGSNTFTLNYLTPTDDDIATNKVESDIAKEISKNNFFSFYIYNNGNYTANYDIKLVPQEESISSEYLRYQICKDNIENCKDIKTLSDSTNNIIYNDELSPNRTESQINPSAYYFLRVWVKSDYAVKENDKVVLKVEIDAKNASGYLDNDNTLVGKLLSDDRVKINNTIPKFDGIADYVVTGDETSGELGLFKAEDDYGISYYYRGAQSYNYVNFAGFTWRIVRINGDGSIRLILDGVLDKVNIPGTETKVHSSGTAFNSSYSKNAYVGYMYGTPGSSTYQAEHEFTGDKTTYTPGVETTGHSTIKVTLDKFYDTYLKTYKSYIADTLFCGDKTLADQDGTDDNIGGVATQYGTNANKTYYAATERLYLSSGTTSITTASPTLMCAENANEDYSRYSVESQTLKSGKTTNGYLTYPIALLSADELVMAGAFKGKSNTAYYLYNADIVGTTYWWTMTPYVFNGSYAYEFSSYSSGSLVVLNDYVNSYYGVRPVINLRSDVLVDSGDGTSKTPYEIK